MKSRMRACLSLRSSSFGRTPCSAYGGVTSIRRTYVSRTRYFVHLADDPPEPLEISLVFLLNLAQPLFELALLALHAVGHVHDDLDAREVYAQLVDQPLHLPQALDVFVGVQTNVAPGSCGVHQPDALVMAQGLGMDPAHPCRHADDVVVEVGGLLLIVAGLRLAFRRAPPAYHCHCPCLDHVSRCRLSSWKSSRSRAERLVGRITRTFAYRSPVSSPRSAGRPWPPRRNTRPFCVSAGTFMLSCVPLSVGTLTSPPSMALVNGTGTSTYRSFPLRSNVGCGCTVTTR